MWNFSKINSLLIRLVKKNTDFSKQIDMTSIFFQYECIDTHQSHLCDFANEN